MLRRVAGSPARPAAAASLAEPTNRRWPPWPATLFLASLPLPWIISLGEFTMSPYRFILIAAVVPCVLKWAAGGAGRFHAADFAVLFFSLWAWVALIANHGLALALQPAGILSVETFGAYFLARCYIRTPDDFRNMVRVVFVIIVCLFPFALLEAVSGRDLLLEAAGKVFPTHTLVFDTRWGLRRVQAFFQHPILFGVSTGCTLALVYLVLGYGEPIMKRVSRAAVVVGTAFLSLSAGPITGLMAQILIIGWDHVLRGFTGRWKLLWLAIIASWVVVEIGSNQSVPEFYMTHFAFDQVNAYYRVLIWTFGTESVLNHPLFGVGLGDWERPDWMPPSIDMFWLFNAIRYGIPSAAMIFLALASIFVALGFKRIDDPKLAAFRTGYLASMTGFFLVGWTVHYWDVTYVLFLFLMGSGVWMIDAGATGLEPDARQARRRGGRAAGTDGPAAPRG